MGLTGLLYPQTGADICTTILSVLIGIGLLHRVHKMQGETSEEKGGLVNG